MKRKAVFFMGRSGIYPFMTRVRQIQAKLDNSIFSGIVYTPAEVIAKLDILQAFQDEVDARNRAHLGQRNEVRKAIEHMVSAQCTFVNAIANGDLSIIEASGFETSKERAKRPAPFKGNTPNAKPLGNGEVMIQVKGIRHHDFIEMQIDGPDGLSNRYSGLYTKFRVSDLPVGVVLRARMRGVNARGEGEWTSSVAFIVHGSVQHHTATA